MVTGSLYVSGKLLTYPSPEPTLTLTSHLDQNFGSSNVSGFLVVCSLSSKIERDMLARQKIRDFKIRRPRTTNYGWTSAALVCSTGLSCALQIVAWAPESVWVPPSSLARGLAPLFPTPSLLNACHAGNTGGYTGGYTGGNTGGYTDSRLREKRRRGKQHATIVQFTKMQVFYRLSYLLINRIMNKSFSICGSNVG